MSKPHVSSCLLCAILCMSCSTFHSQSSPKDATPSADATLTPTTVPGVTWHEDITDRHLYRDGEEYNTAKAMVEATLGQNRRCYVAYAIGNVALVEVINVPPPTLRDFEATMWYVAVILGDTPRLVRLPDKSLFAHFTGVIRANPDILEPDIRLGTALRLATGHGIREREPEPTWIDENGILTIRYHKNIDTGNWMEPSRLHECTITVDARQDYIVDCVDIGPVYDDDDD